MAVLILAPVASAQALEISGTPQALRVVANNDSIEEVFAGLGKSFGLSWQSPSSLEKRITGTYEGPLNRVLTRMLDGYNFVVKANNGQLAITILGSRGGTAVAATTPVSTPPVGPGHASAAAVEQKGSSVTPTAPLLPSAPADTGSAKAAGVPAMPASPIVVAEGPNLNAISGAGGPVSSPSLGAATVQTPRPQPATVSLPEPGMQGVAAPVVQPSTVVPAPRS